MTTNRVFSNRGVPPLLLAALLAGFGCAPDDDDTGTEEGPTCTWPGTAPAPARPAGSRP